MVVRLPALLLLAFALVSLAPDALALQPPLASPSDDGGGADEEPDCTVASGDVDPDDGGEVRVDAGDPDVLGVTVTETGEAYVQSCPIDGLETPCDTVRVEDPLPALPKVYPECVCEVVRDILDGRQADSAADRECLRLPAFAAAAFAPLQVLQ